MFFICGIQGTVEAWQGRLRLYTKVLGAGLACAGWTPAFAGVTDDGRCGVKTKAILALATHKEESSFADMTRCYKAANPWLKALCFLGSALRSNSSRITLAATALETPEGS
jgi:hypothetical protein